VELASATKIHRRLGEGAEENKDPGDRSRRNFCCSGLPVPYFRVPRTLLNGKDDAAIQKNDPDQMFWMFLASSAVLLLLILWAALRKPM
jgi:hypothetical protein